MIEKIDELSTLWQPVPLTITVPAGTTKVLGFDPLRWFVFFSIPSAVIATFELLPLSPDSAVHWVGTGMSNTPLIISQKDHGLLASGEWYCNNTGGVFDLAILSLRWMG